MFLPRRLGAPRERLHSTVEGGKEGTREGGGRGSRLNNLSIPNGTPKGGGRGGAGFLFRIM